MNIEPTSPLITIVTVCFNAENDIDTTLKSVKSLHFENYEHLIIDGQSQDRTLDLVKSCKNPKIRIISEPDGGIYDAMNKGIRLANGTYITFLNAGDYYHDPNVLDYVYTEIKKGYELVSGDFLLHSANGIRPINSDKIQKETLRKRFEICHQTVFVKNQNLPSYSMDYQIKSDYKWVLDIVKKIDKEKIKKIDKALVTYKDDGFSTHSFYRNISELIKLHYHEFGLGQVILNTDDYAKRAGRSLKKFILTRNTS